MLLTDTAAVVKGLIESEKEIGVQIKDVNDVAEEVRQIRVFGFYRGRNRGSLI